jgi:DNA-binding GntR family transcriptional regulator
MAISELTLRNSDTLTDIVTARLRLAIVTGALGPGERISEPLLADQLQVSRSPVREALHRLEEERLVARTASRRITVWLPTEADVEEIFSLRVMLESLAAERTVQQLDDEDFAALEQLVHRQEGLIANQEYLELIREDKCFHEYFVKRAEHTRLREWWQQIMGQWEVLIYRRMHYAPNKVVPSIVPDHRALLEAFYARDLDKVVWLHRTINERVQRQTKAAVRSRLQLGDIRINSEELAPGVPVP